MGSNVLSGMNNRRGISGIFSRRASTLAVHVLDISGLAKSDLGGVSWRARSADTSFEALLRQEAIRSVVGLAQAQGQGGAPPPQNRCSRDLRADCGSKSWFGPLWRAILEKCGRFPIIRCCSRYRPSPFPGDDVDCRRESVCGFAQVVEGVPQICICSESLGFVDEPGRCADACDTLHEEMIHLWQLCGPKPFKSVEWFNELCFELAAKHRVYGATCKSLCRIKSYRRRWGRMAGQSEISQELCERMCCKIWRVCVTEFLPAGIDSESGDGGCGPRRQPPASPPLAACAGRDCLISWH